MYQLPLSLNNELIIPSLSNYDKLKLLLTQDLNFHANRDQHQAHNFHSFPAKFPPQLPRKFIESLTKNGDIVLDPMMGSGTTLLEACFLQRRAIGFDIDPLAMLITRVKTSIFQTDLLQHISKRILSNARKMLLEQKNSLSDMAPKKWDTTTLDFINYWFTTEAQNELCALIYQINQIELDDVRYFFLLAFSSIIITKNGGVSLALDLAHTRPHRAKYIIDPNDDQNKNLILNERHKIKILRSPFDEFEKRVHNQIKSVSIIQPRIYKPHFYYGNSQNLPLPTSSVDLIITSPPYASNAIDYMRAHKFSLTWMGYSINNLEKIRKQYIGSENSIDTYESLSGRADDVVSKISSIDANKGRVLHRYYSEMTLSIKEMFRVLRSGSAAIVVVGNSMMRGLSTDTALCLADIGQNIGFSVPAIGTRNLERNRRMMPAGNKIDQHSQIQQRMHEEYVIGFYKP